MVLDGYVKLILEIFSDDELTKYSKCGYNVLGMVHKWMARKMKLLQD